MRHSGRWLVACAVLAACGGAPGMAADVSLVMPEPVVTLAPPPGPALVPEDDLDAGAVLTALRADQTDARRVVDVRHQRPAWLGTLRLTRQPNGLGEILPTPAELRDRQLLTIDVLPPPPDDAFHMTISEMTPELASRTTWKDGCPTGLDDLRHLEVSHWGFDRLNHTGELVVHADHAENLVGVFRKLHEAGYPIEQLGIAGPSDLMDVDPADPAFWPTGDGNGSGAFVCRASTGGRRWSQHAHGLAVDLNPFHNPYIRGADRLIPERAEAYLDRRNVRTGMIIEGDVVVRAFDAIGWKWGGRWSSLKDYMHFSLTGR